MNANPLWVQSTIALAVFGICKEMNLHFNINASDEWIYILMAVYRIRHACHWWQWRQWWHWWQSCHRFDTERQQTCHQLLCYCYWNEESLEPLVLKSGNTLYLILIDLIKSIIRSYVLSVAQIEWQYIIRLSRIWSKIMLNNNKEKHFSYRLSSVEWKGFSLIQKVYHIMSS